MLLTFFKCIIYRVKGGVVPVNVALLHTNKTFKLGC